MNTLKEVRKSKKLSMSEIEKLTGIQCALQSLIETGVTKPGRRMQRRFESILGHNIDWVETIHWKSCTPKKAERTLEKLLEQIYGLDNDVRKEFIQHLVRVTEQLKERYPRLQRTKFNDTKASTQANNGLYVLQ
ncbi:MAG: helix-turn-helix transcriptional regulator [Bacteroidales bacterium]|nr:helix-turn-helix transcriptional regulator [Bacteroidales bacterium]